MLNGYSSNNCFSQTRSHEIGKNCPVGQKGTISFVLKTDKTYSNGSSVDNFSQTLIDLPGLGQCLFEQNYIAVSLALQWEKDETHIGFYIYMTEFPGPGEYSIIYTWDADQGLADGYFNGIPFRLEDVRFYEPWQMNGQSIRFDVPDGPIRVENVQIFAKYITKDEALELVPQVLVGKMAHVILNKDLPSPIEVRHRKGDLIYDSPLNTEESVKDWVLEGPGDISFNNKYMTMRSQIPDPPDGSTGHFNFWCPMDFPENMVVEWEMKPLTNLGVCHLFFAAKGQNGEDLFDPSLPERDGHYRQYHSGSINNYFMIYYSNLHNMRTTNAATTWIMKSNPPSLLSLGQIGVKPGTKKFHRIRLIKESGHIQLQVNGKVFHDFTDPGNDRWGTIYKDGKIGFRQMAVFAAAYRNFKVWELQ
jgi:hypothetical protein